MFLFTFVFRVPKEDPSGRTIILEAGEFQRIKVCFIIITAYKIHNKKPALHSLGLQNLLRNHL